MSILESVLVFLDTNGQIVSNPRDPQDLLVAAKRYRYNRSDDNRTGLTLLLAHCIGGHKEGWEPMLEHVFVKQSRKHPDQRIREAWAFDWQSHGDSALVNRKLLEQRTEVVSVYEWAAVISAFTASETMKSHSFVAIGHSAGAGTLVNTAKGRPAADIPYAAFILIEPTIVSAEMFYEHFDIRLAQLEFTVGAVAGRRHTWKDRQTAHEWMAKRYPWDAWDVRAVKAFVDHGLGANADGSVSLKCLPGQESITYPDVDGHFEAATEMERLCKQIPIHLVWGSFEELVPDYIQDALMRGPSGPIARSVTMIEDAGHMVVQEKPELLATAICEILDSLPSIPQSPRSRL